MALAGGLEAQFGTGLRLWHILEFRHGADRISSIDHVRPYFCHSKSWSMF
jgi:hypothetical protein